MTVGAAASVSEALRAAARRLRASGSRSPRLDAELLLATALGVERVTLLAESERVLTPTEERRFEGYLCRREAHEPIAYIRCRRAFRTLELEVTPDVLIPRPETETLVEVALEALAAAPAEHGQSFAVDVGTGSGCIALALAAEDPFVHVTAVDVSEAAVELARHNAARLGLGGRLRVLRSDLLAALPPEERFHLIVSNPPYIPAAEYEALECNVRDYEPRLALHGGADGLDVYRRLVPEALGRLRAGGTLAVEVGAGQAAAVRKLFEAADGYADALERADLGGMARVVWAAKAA